MSNIATPVPATRPGSRPHLIPLGHRWLALCAATETGDEANPPALTGLVRVGSGALQMSQSMTRDAGAAAAPAPYSDPPPLPHTSITEWNAVRQR